MSKGIIYGFDITKYATDPDHEVRIAAMAKKINVLVVDQIDKYITSRAPNSPITGAMIYEAANKYNLGSGGISVMVALMQNDSMFGTKGKGSRSHNPGNVGNDDTGAIKDWGTWEKGVDAVAKWLFKHRVAA
jgi:hypothetical protein